MTEDKYFKNISDHCAECDKFLYEEDIVYDQITRKRTKLRKPIGVPILCTTCFHKTI